jgi:hypothetical protein
MERQTAAKPYSDGFVFGNPTIELFSDQVPRFFSKSTLS